VSRSGSFAAQAKGYPDRVFTALCHDREVDFFEQADRRLKRDSAPDLSGITDKDDGQQREDNLQALPKRLKTGSDKATPLKRVGIDKDKSKKRPIGLSELEDKRVQTSAERLLSAVYRADF